MKIIKLKKDVSFDVLLEYGFIYNELLKRYERPVQWTLDDVCHQLVVEKESRMVYTDIRKTSNVNEEYLDVSAKLFSIHIVMMYEYIEIINDETIIINKVIPNK